jgi:ABC-type dipeptide/oligopeptide/nickel transport system permease subunit
MSIKLIIGIVLILFGIALGGFLGLYFCLYGGIVQVINGIKDSWNAIPIAIGVARVLCTSLVGSVSALALILPGWTLLMKE